MTQHKTKLPSAEVQFSQRTHWAEGQPISELMARALEHPDLISLAAGFVDNHTLPAAEVRTALDAILADTDAARAALQYGTTNGFAPLREILRSRFLQSDQVNEADSRLSIDQFVLTAGSNQLLHLVGEALLDEGDIVLCASPTYLVYMGTLRNLGARTVGVASDVDGLIPQSLEEQLQRLEQAGDLPRVKMIYVVSYFDNPAGTTLLPERRAQVVEIAKRWSKSGRIHVVDDCAYRKLRYAGEDVPSMRTYDEEGDTVVVAGTFSKSFSPGIRVGWGILPPDLIEPVCNQKGNIDFGSPNFSQHIVHKVLEQGLYDPHVQNLRAAYNTKLQAMLAAMDKHLASIPDVDWVPPQGGLYVWLKLPEGMDAGAEGPLFDLAVEEGMLYVPGQFCYPSEGEPVRRNRIRLSFGVQTPEGIEQGIAALARAIQRVP